MESLGDGWCGRFPGLECLLNIVRCLRLGSCLSVESGNTRGGSLAGSSKKNGSSFKKVGSFSLYVDMKRREQLRKIPGRMFLSGSSEIASLFTQQGKKGINQDAMIVWENFCSRADTVLCGVFDGHGPYGHLVAKRVRDSLPLKLHSHWEVHEKSNEVLSEITLLPAETTFSSIDLETRPSIDVVGELAKSPENIQALKESFLKACKVMDKELRMYTSIDCFCSGTTAVVLVKQGQDLVIGNIGDSRAVLGTRDENESLTAVQLTVDLKPSNPAEKERIQKCKGRVFALNDEPEVQRVWLPKINSPGLAMARAFGDFCLKDFGVISVPEIFCRRISDKDEFVVLATDGIWDVLSNEQVVEIVSSCLKRSVAAQTVVESAISSWKSKYPTSRIDDCAVVCLFLHADEQETCSIPDSHSDISSFDCADPSSQPLLQH